MTGGDLRKLNAAGFRVFYQEEQTLTIYESRPGVRLKESGPFKNKYQMAFAWGKLMQDAKHISR